MHPASIQQTRTTRQPIGPRHRLYLAVATSLLAASAYAGPTGGEIVGGSGDISQSGTNTTINQFSDRLSIEWQTFNINRNERVEFVQPDSQSIALNRILDSNGSRIMGQIDANGHVILMNPNGILFGADAVVNVGGLVASGLNIGTQDFMNGDLLLEAVAGSAGTVINRGLINAATGGNVALVGTQVTNSGLISAHLGHVALASGQQAVITFDEQGLLGVRIDQETLQSQLGRATGVNNSGTVDAAGGKILLTGSVSQDLFSRAVNTGGLGGETQTIVHDDGSFTLGASVDVINSGTLNVAATEDQKRAGEVIMAGNLVTHRGAISADHAHGGEAGSVQLHSSGNRVQLSNGGSISASGSEGSGHVMLTGDHVAGAVDSKIATTGAATLSGTSQVHVPTLSAANATLHSAGTVHQTGALRVTGNTHLDLSTGGRANLANTANDLHQITLDARAGRSASVIQNAGDLMIGETSIDNASVRLVTTGTLSQAGGGNINVNNGTLRMDAASLNFADYRSSRIQLQNSHLNAYFTDEAKLINIDMPGAGDSSRVFLSTLGGPALTSLGRQGFSADLRYAVNEYGGVDGLHIDHLTAENLTISAIYDVTQTGPIQLNGTLNLNLTADGAVYFNNPANDFRRVNMNLGHVSYVELADINDLVLGDMYLEDSSVNISAPAPGATITQANNTSIIVNDSNLEIGADRVLLGHSNNNYLRVNGYSNLDVHFRQLARVVDTGFGNQFWDTTRVHGDWYFSSLFISGGGGNFRLNASYNSDNQLTFAELSAADASIQKVRYTRQTGAIQLTGNLHVEGGYNSYLSLMHADNDFNTLSVNTNFYGTMNLRDRNSIALGELNLHDTSNYYITAADSITQLENTAIILSDAALTLNAASIVLGRNSEGSGVTMDRPLLNLRFSKHIHIEESLYSDSDYDHGWIRVEGVSAYNGDKVKISTDLSSFNLSNPGDNNPLELVVTFGDEDAYEPTTIGRMRGQDAEISTTARIEQTGPAYVIGNLHINLSENAGVALMHSENDFNTLYMNTSYTGYLSLYDSNDLILGNLGIIDSIVALSAAGDITQRDGTKVLLSHSALFLDAAGILLGRTDQGSGIFPSRSSFDAKFSERVRINNSIFADGDHNYTMLSVAGSSNDSFDQIKIATDVDTFLAANPGETSPLELVMAFRSSPDHYDLTNIEKLRSMDAEIVTSGTFTQTGPIEVGGVLHLNNLFGHVVFDNPQNRIHQLDIDSEYYSSVKVHATGDIHLGNWTANDSSVEVRAFHDPVIAFNESSIRQLPNTRIQGGETTVSLEADNIFLGAEGTSSIGLYGSAILENKFYGHMHFDGDISLIGTYASLKVIGSEHDNVLTVGPNANFELDGYFFDYIIDLIGGENTMHLHRDLPLYIDYLSYDPPQLEPVDTWTRSGPNMIYVYDPLINPIPWIRDYAPAKDRIVYVP